MKPFSQQGGDVGGIAVGRQRRVATRRVLSKDHPLGTQNCLRQPLHVDLKRSRIDQAAADEFECQLVCMDIANAEGIRQILDGFGMHNLDACRPIHATPKPKVIRIVLVKGRIDALCLCWNLLRKIGVGKDLGEVCTVSRHKLKLTFRNANAMDQSNPSGWELVTP